VFINKRPLLKHSFGLLAAEEAKNGGNIEDDPTAASSAPAFKSRNFFYLVALFSAKKSGKCRPRVK
jgi:hypothetical protein